MTEGFGQAEIIDEQHDHRSLLELTRAVLDLLGQAGETVAVAESLTGGLLSAALTEHAGSSAFFRGGVVPYATDLKAGLVGVDAELLARVGAVDPAVAEGLARGARLRLGADWGVGVTGVAGPDPQDGKPVGTVFISVVGPGFEFAAETIAQLELAGDRNRIRTQTVVQAVGLLRAAILRRNADRD